MVEGFEGDGLCIVAKLHHSLMDGVAGMQFMASLFALEPNSPSPPAPEPQLPEAQPGDWALIAGSLASTFRRPLFGARAAGRSLGAGVRVARHLIDHRGSDSAPLSAPFTAPDTPFDTPVTPQREVAFTSLPLDRIKSVARSFEVTVNDVVLAVVAGAVRGLPRFGRRAARKAVGGCGTSVRAR